MWQLQVLIPGKRWRFDTIVTRLKIPSCSTPWYLSTNIPTDFPIVCQTDLL